MSDADWIIKPEDLHSSETADSMIGKELKSVYDYVPRDKKCQYVAVDGDDGELCEFYEKPRLDRGAWDIKGAYPLIDSVYGYEFTPEPIHVSELNCNKTNPLPNSEADEIVERLKAESGAFFDARDIGSAVGYEALSKVLSQALDQAASGKGKDRHAKGLPFHKQSMQTTRDKYGSGFTLGQAAKKMEEQQGFSEPERKIAELLGAINYIAGEIIAIKRENDIDLF